MLRHPSTEIAIAVAHDLARALLSPSPYSPLSPISDSQRHQLLQLSSIFLPHTPHPDNIPTPPQLPTTTQSPTPPPISSSPAQSSVQRVVPTATPNNPANSQASVPRVAPAAIISNPKRITWAPTVTGGIAPIATYQTATINPGQRHRLATNAQKNAAHRAAFLSASITIHSGIKSHTWCKRRSASRRSRRRRVRQPLPKTHVNHAQRHVLHLTITSHVANFATQIYTIASTLQSTHTVIDAVAVESHEQAQFIRGPNDNKWL
jgi:hypothetical protein